MVSPSTVCRYLRPLQIFFGQKPWGVLDLIKENWEKGPSPSKNEIQYVMDLRAKLHTLGQLSRENFLEAQERQQRLYNRGTKLRQFSESKEKTSFSPPDGLNQFRTLPFVFRTLPSFRVIRGSSHVSAPYGRSAAAACCIFCSLFGQCHNT